MDPPERAIIVDLVHLEAVETQEQAEEQQEQLDDRLVDRRRVRSEASSASRTAACVAPSPPDPDYFVG